MAKQTVRLDVLVVERGLLPSRQAAQAAIIDGGVLVDGQKVTKPGTPVKPEAQLQLTVNWQASKFVSRGGYKLEKALNDFGVDVTGKVCLDIGASTGGFTDCLLQAGAKRVYAIDVGYGQLDWKLRQDERVVVMERVNARHLTPDELYGDDSERATLAVFDVSFISLTKVMPSVVSLLHPDGAAIVALIKPQFEAGREAVGKGGVVRDAATHVAVLKNVIAATAAPGVHTVAVTFSPVKGPAGNIEFLGYWHVNCSDAGHADVVLDVEAIVAAAHESLSG